MADGSNPFFNVLGKKNADYSSGPSGKKKEALTPKKESEEASFVGGSVLSNMLKSSEPGNVALSQFLAQKNSANPSDRLKALRNFDAQSIGEENWIIGLLGMLFDKTNSDPGFLSEAAQELAKFFGHSEHVYDNAIAHAFSLRYDEFDAPTRSLIGAIAKTQSEN